MACVNGIITEATIEEMIEMKERLLYLEQHKNKIWCGSDDKNSIPVSRSFYRLK